MAERNGPRNGFSDKSRNGGESGGDSFARQLPKALEAEKAVLGSILLLPAVLRSRSRAECMQEGA